MNLGKKTSRFGFNGNQVSMNIIKKENKNFSGKYFNTWAMFLFISTMVISGFVFTGTANAQFLVQPGEINMTVTSRQKVDDLLKIHNFDPNQSVTVDFKVIELTQKENGEWLPVDFDPCSPFDFYPTLDLSKLSSCSSWVKLEKSSVIVPANGDANIGIKINVPQVRIGFYGATIIASTKAVVNGQVPVIVRTGIPVILTVSSRRITSDSIEIKDMNMVYVPGQGADDGATYLTMNVVNNGTSFPRLKPVIRVRYFYDNHWRIITTHEFNDIGIIPNKYLSLRSNIGKSLPSGKYQLDGVLYVDGEIRGTRGKFGKEIEFVGDPMRRKPAPDAPIDTDPSELIIMASPGSNRPGHIKIHNATPDTIRIEPILEIPKAFKGIAADNVVVADAMTCLKWLSFDDKSVTLKEYDTRNLQVNVAMPEDVSLYPYYYASLGLKATYLDGQDAGTKWVNVCIETRNTTAEPGDIECDSISMSERDPAKSLYYVQAVFKNNGKTHVIPTMVKAAVAQADGFGHTAAMLKTDKTGMFLPYESRLYSGTLDFTTVQDGDYNLEVKMDYPTKKNARKQIRIRVSKIGDAKVPEIIDRNVKTNDLITVQWD